MIFIQAQADEAVATALVSSCPVSVFGDGFLYVMAAPAEGSKASCAGFNVVGDLTVGASVTCMVTGGTAMALNGELTLADGATLRWPTELKLSEQADTQTALSSRVLMNGETAADMAVVAAPSDPVTRGVAVFNLWRMKGSPKPEGEYPFSDEAASDFLQDAIHWAGTTGIAKGYGDGAFGANDPITNEQFALMAYRLRGCPAVEGDFAADYPYAGSFSPWAREAVLWCGRQGSWDPQDILTHGTLDRLVAGMSERD